VIEEASVPTYIIGTVNKILRPNTRTNPTDQLRPGLLEPVPLVALDVAERPLFIGIDIGGTSIKIGLVDMRGRTLAYRSVATEPREGYSAALERMYAAIGNIIDTLGLTLHDVKRIGMGIPGMINAKGGELLGAHNLPTWDNTPVAALLEDHIGIPVTLVNDANAAAYGEFWIGRGRDHHSLAMVTLGTGVGGGIVVDDHLIGGAHDFGGEVGHLIINASDDSRWCGCGQRGHLEAYCSATAVKNRLNEALDAGSESSLRKLLNEGHELTPLDVAAAAAAGDPLSYELVMETARYLGIGITNILHMIDPEILLIGGAMTFGGDEQPLGRDFINAVRHEVRRRAMPIQSKHTVIEFATLGGAAGFIGAAGIARVEERKAAAV
jgi:glucokinase